jgi:uncharacterized protein YndB with AHSA1/START domain
VGAVADIIHRIGINAPAAKVFDAVATAQGVAGWWTRDTTGTATVGGAVTTRFRRRDGSEIGRMAFEMTGLDPEREVRWRFTDGPPDWMGTEATFELTQEGEMTILNFGHRNWKAPTESMAHCSMKWAVFLLSLRELVETGRGRPSPEDTKIDNWN